MMHVEINTDGLLTIAQNLHELLPGNVAYANVMRAAAASVLAKVKERIHQRGQASDASDIGTYAIKPIYISTVTGTGKGLNTHQGKTGKSAFAKGKKKGQQHTSQYFAGGYGQFKAALGLEGSKVNLYQTGELCNELTILGQPGSTGYGIGWTDDELTKRAHALERKYGKEIWELTDIEKKELSDIALNQVAERINLKN